MKERQNVRISQSSIQNVIVPIVLFLCSFYDVNKGVDIKDAGYSMNYFLHFDNYPGNRMISRFWSNVVGHLFSLLPGGDTWLGLSLYATSIIGLTVVIAYFVCKRVMDWRMAAVSEIFAIFFCWNPNVILYDYMSFLLFTLGGSLLLIALEKEEKKRYYVWAGVVLGMNVFVRLPNLAEMAAIVLLWYTAFVKKWTWKQAVQRTLLCVTGYAIACVVSIASILKLYGFYELKLCVYNLFNLSQSQDNYGLVYMVTETFRIVVGYAGYLVPLILLALLLGVLLKKDERRGIVYKVIFFGLTCGYFWLAAKQFKLFNWNFQTHESVLGLACLFLLWGLVCSVLTLIVSKSHNARIYALVFIGVFFVMPLGSNNTIYLEIMNMFLLIPITVFLTANLLNEWKERIPSLTGLAINNAVRVICYASAAVMMVQTIGYGMNYTFNDSIEVKAENYSYAGMYSSEERIALLDEMYAFCEQEELLGKEAIFYCNAPGLSFILDMPSALESSWADWYTFSIVRFAITMEELEWDIDNGQEHPVVILSTPYDRYYRGEDVDWAKYPESMIDDKAWTLNKFLRDNQYERIYVNEEFAIYTVSDIAVSDRG